MDRSHLVHFLGVEYCQFVTFRTFDSSSEFLNKLLNQELSASQNQFNADKYLDNSQDGAYLNDEVLSCLFNCFKENDAKLFKLYAFAIMPNHVHLLIKPKIKLCDVMQKIKGSSAFSINKILRRKGVFWAPDYYDRAIRTQKHFDTVYNYIKNNPLKLTENKDLSLRFYGCYEE